MSQNIGDLAHSHLEIDSKIDHTNSVNDDIRQIADQILNKSQMDLQHDENNKSVNSSQSFKKLINKETHDMISYK